eukprot:Lankesteria_metandrocarpae@DN4065_c0_g1_i1.p1
MSQEEAQQPEFYEDGDINVDWRPLAAQEMDAFFGDWQTLGARSDSTDGMMSALGVGMLIRSVMNRMNPKTKIERVVRDDSHFIKIATHFPFGKVKEADIPTNGGSFEQEDTDTGATWSTRAYFHAGRLLQKRMSDKGTMYDVRCVFDKDPEGKTTESPVMLFKWTFINAKTNKTIVCNRWLAKQPTTTT